MLRILKSKKRYLPILALLALVLLGQPILSYAQYQGSGIFSDLTVTSLLAPASLNKETEQNLSISHQDALRDFYQQREDHLLWSGKRGLEEAREVADILKESWTHGLNPENYHAQEIEKLLALDSLSWEQKLRLDVLMTDAAVAYARDLSGMRVDPAAIKQKAEYWRQRESADSVLTKIAAAPDKAALLNAMAPNGKLYKALREELVRLHKEESHYDDLLPMRFSGTLFKPGQRHGDVKALRARLDVAYDSERGPESYYDDALAAAVMAFQKQHGLKADGIIGPKTLALLNRTKKDHMEQVVANLERLRWLDEQKPPRYIMVNIPSQMLWAIEDGKIVHEMPVVVGRPQRETQSFKAEITGVRFNPTWTVPPGIKIKDMLPKLKEDPLSLAASGIDIYRNGKTIDPTSVDWNTISRRELMSYKMMQHPGDHNALGYVRVLMPNDYDIYLHDTNHRELFVEDERLMSSGCVRLSEPKKIADFVLSKNENWSQERRDALISAGKTVDIPVAEKFPVYIVYQSMWLDSQDKVVYGPDVYKQDKKLIAQLERKQAYQFPVMHAALEDKNQKLASADDVSGHNHNDTSGLVSPQ